MHSYTPCYEGSKRDVEIGVLFHELDSDRELLCSSRSADATPEQRARHVCDQFKVLGYDARLNEPWSGLNGLMTGSMTLLSVDSELPVMMLEVRNDLLQNQQWRSRFIEQLKSIDFLVPM